MGRQYRGCAKESVPGLCCGGGANRGIAERIVTHTPDAYLDSAMTRWPLQRDWMLARPAVVHGGCPGRVPYLGLHLMWTGGLRVD